MKLRMDVLKSRIETEQTNLIKFMKHKCKEVDFFLTTEIDYMLILHKVNMFKYSVDVVDVITLEKKNIGLCTYVEVAEKSDEEIFLVIEQSILNLFGGKMFDTWVEQQVLRTKGRKKLADLICKYYPDLNHDGVLSMLSKKRTGEVNFMLLPTLLKPVKVAFCNCEIMDYEILSVE